MQPGVLDARDHPAGAGVGDLGQPLVAAQWNALATAVGILDIRSVGRRHQNEPVGAFRRLHELDRSRRGAGPAAAEKQGCGQPGAKSHGRRSYEGLPAAVNSPCSDLGDLLSCCR